MTKWKMPDTKMFKEYNCEVCGKNNSYLGKKMRCCRTCGSIYYNQIDIAYWISPKGANLKMHKQEKKKLIKLDLYKKDKKQKFIEWGKK